MLGRLAALIVKEFLAIWQDPKSRVIVIVPPLVQLFVFSYAATFDIQNAKLAVLNEDMSSESRDLVARFSASHGFKLAEVLTDAREIAPTLDGRKAEAVLRIPERFAADLKTRGSAKVQFLVDGRSSNTALVLMGYATEIVETYNAGLATQAEVRGPPAELVTRAWYNPTLESQWFIVPGLVGTLTLVIANVLSGLSVARERELGTFEQLLVTPLRPLEILVGKTVPALVIGIAEGAAIAAIAVTWFHVPFRGSLVLLLASLVVFLLSAVGIGLMISAIARTQQQAIVGSFLFVMPAVILSGFATPIQNMPQAIQWLTYVNPLRYMLVILRGIFLRDLEAVLVLHQVWPMAVIAVVTGGIATWLFRHRLG